MSSRVGLQPDVQEVRLSVGERATVKLAVTNLSDVVDAFDITVRNLNDGWYSIAPERISLFPRAVGDVIIQVNPPAQFAAMAGAYPFQIVATSRDAPTEFTIVTIQLYVAPVSELKMEIEPQRVRARQGNYTLRLINEGNTERLTVLRPSDPEGLLVFAFGKARTGTLADAAARKRVDGGVSVGQGVTDASPVMLPSTLETQWTGPNSQDAQGALELTLPAASIVELPLHVKTTKRVWLGRQMDIQFDIKATPPGVEWEEKDARKTTGQLVYDPYLAAWSGLPMTLRRVLMAVLALAILGLLLFMLINPNRPSSASNQGVSASATLTAIASSAAATQTALAKVLGAGGASAAKQTAEAMATKLAGGGGGAVDSASATQTAEALLAANLAGLPRIDKFDMEFAPDGSTQTAVWTVSDALTVTINGAKVEPVGTQTVPTNTEQSLVLVAMNNRGQVSRSLGLMLLLPPEIRSFVAEPAGPVAPGTEVTLRWTTVRAEQVTLDGTPVPDTDRESGSVKINPAASTDVVLTAQNAIGQVQSSVIIPVIPPTPVP